MSEAQLLPGAVPSQQRNSLGKQAAVEVLTISIQGEH
jgi:hypothetical protein